MLSIFRKEVKVFFSSLIAYIVIGIFLISVGLFMWVFNDTSVLDYYYATMEQLFSIAPLVFLFLIPAITMRSFAEETNSGTLELLYTKPLSILDIVGGKFLANFVLVLFAIAPTLLYYYSVYQLGSPKGNLDTGAITGSYIGLLFLSATFIAIGMLASALTSNQIVSFILGAFLCFFFHWAFTYLAKMPFLIGGADLIVQKIGINYHYGNISKGIIDSRQLVYFISLISLFMYSTVMILESRRK